MPLNLIFRSSTLLANLIIGRIFFKKRYDTAKYSAVLLVSIGIFSCTLASGSNIANSRPEGNLSEFFWWTVGVAIMSSKRFFQEKVLITILCILSYTLSHRLHGFISRDHVQALREISRRVIVLHAHTIHAGFSPFIRKHLEPCKSSKGVARNFSSIHR